MIWVDDGVWDRRRRNSLRAFAAASLMLIHYGKRGFCQLFNICNSDFERGSGLFITQCLIATTHKPVMKTLRRRERMNVIPVFSAWVEEETAILWGEDIVGKKERECNYLSYAFYKNLQQADATDSE